MSDAPMDRREAPIEQSAGRHDSATPFDHVVVAAPAARLGFAAGRVGFRIGYIPGWEAAQSDRERVERLVNLSPRWVPQWWTLLRAHSVLIDCYAGAPMGNVLAVHAVELGCLASQWLEEHLEREGLPASAFRRSTPDLVDANDLANTHKHAARDAAKLRVGSVLCFHVQPGSEPVISLAFARATDSSVTERDALELLNGCVGAWREFLLRHERDPVPLPA